MNKKFYNACSQDVLLITEFKQQKWQMATNKTSFRKSDFYWIVNDTG